MDTIGADIKAVLDLVPDPMMALGASGEIMAANAAAEDLFGYGPGELAGKAVETVIPQHRLNVREFSNNPARPQRRSAGSIVRIAGVHKSGREIPVEISIGPAGPAPVVCTLRDVSRRVLIEDKLRQTIDDLERRVRSSDVDARRSNEHFKLFLKHAPAAIALLDRQMRYLIVSDRYLQDYGLTDRGDLHGVSHYDIFPEVAKNEKWKDAHRRCLAGEVLKCDEDPFERTDGRIDWMHWELHPWRTGEGKIGGMLLFSELITARKNAELALKKSYSELEQRVAERTAALEQLKNDADRANSQKSWFVEAASHDLRQPLQASLAYLSVLERKTSNPEVEDLCDKARQPLKAMGDILDVLLDISDLESGQVKPHIADFPLNDLLMRVITNAQNQAQEKGLRLSCVATDLWVRSDSKLLERVVSNFVTNAVRYTAKGLIGIYCEQIGDCVCISVTDTGIGIPTEALATIFEDHVQLGNPARDRRKGLGLGLSIAKRIADSLGHRISVNSEVGSGSSFTIELPAVGATAVSRPAETLVAEPVRETPVVLLIDDDQDVAEAMQMLLQSYGYEAYRAPGRDAALAMLDSGLIPGLVLCDYRLPGANGIEVIRQVRHLLNTEVPSVLVTGDMGLTDLPADIGRCALLHKPVDVDQFFAAVGKLGA